ncbi:MAG: alpha/beta hydrolase family protein [Jatrophihabitans sp.]
MVQPTELTLEVATQQGTAQVVMQAPRAPSAVLLIGHGAGGGIDAPDILAVRDAALGLGVAVGRVLQPYRVRGSRAPAPAPRLDEAWVSVSRAVSARRALRGLPIVHAGRSSGARVACRCADELDAAAVVALAFPVHPPGKPEKSRLSELTAVTAPVLVVQGERDPFGCPPPSALRPPSHLVVIPGADHALKRDPVRVGLAVAEFLIDRGWSR